MDTKIFGIGLHKTGGTSLCKALGELGYNAQHCLSSWEMRDNLFFRRGFFYF